MKVRHNQGSNSQPPGHESNTLTTEPPKQGFKGFYFGCHGNQNSLWNTVIWINLTEGHLRNIPVNLVKIQPRVSEEKFFKKNFTDTHTEMNERIEGRTQHHDSSLLAFGQWS